MRAVEVGVALAVVAAAAALRATLLRRRAVPAGVALLAEAIPDALGDAVLAIDAAGRIGHANSAAGRLLGASVADLVDRDLAAVAPELHVLLRGLERGPARARIAIPAPGGAVRVRAAVARVSAHPPWALAVLRPLPQARPSPPPLPRAPAAVSSHGEARAALAAAAASLGDPVARAVEALSLLWAAAPARRPSRFARPPTRRPAASRSRGHSSLRRGGVSRRSPSPAAARSCASPSTARPPSSPPDRAITGRRRHVVYV